MIEKEWPTLFKPTAGDAVQQWRVWVVANHDGTAHICVEHGQVDGKLRVERDHVTEGKNAGRRNATTPLQQALAEAQSAHDKKLSRKGYALDPKDSKRFEGPMLAHRFDKFGHKVAWPALVQPKYDGYRCLAWVEEGGVRLVSREHKPIETMSHVAEAIARHFPPGMVLDGELYVHGPLFQQLSGLIRKRQPGSETVFLYVYDSVADVPFHARLAAVRRFWPKAMAREPLVLTPTTPCADEEALEAMEQGFVDEGFEGAILRWGDAPYEAGSRSYSLLKVKRFEDDEAEVLSVRPGRGKFAGMAVLRCRAPWGAEFECTAPGTHEEKVAAYDKRDELVGRKVTFKYKGKHEGGVPRHPVAARWHEEL